MLYLLDANVLIDANRDYYPMERVPEFWDWIESHAQKSNIKMPLPIFNEVKKGKRKKPKDPKEKDQVADWLFRGRPGAILLLQEEPNRDLVQEVIEDGYAPDLTDVEVEKIGNDPFLIASALVEKENRCVVTTERSRPSRKRANRHIPDVCQDLKIRCIHTFELIEELDFRTRA